MRTISASPDALTLGHLDLARSIARSFSAAGPDASDILQVAYLGLVKASQRFDVAKGVPFPAFAVPTIAGEVKKYLRDSCWMVRPPRKVQDLRSETAKAASLLAQQLGHEPSVAELSNRLGAESAAVEEALNCHSSMRPDSLDAPVGDGSWADRLCSADNAIDRSDELLSLRAAVKELPVKERELLYRRYFCEESQQLIGECLGMTQMQVSRLLARTLVKLQQRLLASPEQAVPATIPPKRILPARSA